MTQILGTIAVLLGMIIVGLLAIVPTVTELRQSGPSRR